jgi:hypothetical protein
VLKSLFGDIGPLWTSNDRTPAHGETPPEDFAETAVLERGDTESRSRRQIGDRHVNELVVSGSSAQAIRDHFALSRADLDTASRQITMFDPAGAWAGAVIKALSDAAGGPVERLHLREQASLRSLATIERTTIVRRNEDTLKIYNADVRAPGPDTAEIPITLMERSHLAVVIVGPMQPQEIDTLLATLVEASRQPTWRCPNLLFLLPPGALELSERIGRLPWPVALRLQVHDESLTSASAVWNAMLGAWNQIKALPGWGTADEADSLPFPAFSLGTPTLAEPAAVTGPGELHALDEPPAAPAAKPRRTLDAARASRALLDLTTLEGLLGCAVVHASSGLALARHKPDDQPFDVELASAAATQVLRAQRLAAGSLGLDAPVEDIMAAAGPRLFLLRTVAHHPELFVFALLDKQRTNLAIARHKLMEVEKALA